MDKDIVDQEGVQGRIVRDVHRAGGEDRIAVEAGEDRFLVPARFLKRRGHNYYLPFRFRDFKAASTADSVTVPVIEEQLRVETRPRDKKVQIEKHVVTHDEQLELPTVLEEISIERVSVDREVDAPVEAHYEGETLVIPLLEEVVVTQKRLVLREEVRVTKRRVESTTPEKVTLRREEATVKRDDE